MLVLFDNWTSFFRDKVVPWRIGMAEQLRTQLENEVLPRFIASQRWYAAKGEPISKATIADSVIWDVGGLSWLLNFILVKDAVYFLPLSLAWEVDEDHVRALAPLTVARVRQQANVGVLGDAIADEGFCRHVVKAICGGRTVPTAHGSLRFIKSAACPDLSAEELASIQLTALHTQSTNTSVQLGDRFFLKCYRRMRPGVNPEFEVGRYLTEVARFPHCVPLAGAVEYVSKKETTTVALLQGYLPNQGDAWGYTLAYLERFLATAPVEKPHGGYVSLMQTLSTRTAQLHRAFAMRSGDPAFDPEPLGPQDFEAWKATVREEANDTLGLLERTSSDKAAPLLSQRAKLMGFIDACAAPKGAGLKTRHHGDYHLGQVLIANNDFVIIDFEGEPSRPLADARRKHSPLRDVAGMLRSFNYAVRVAMSEYKTDDLGVRMALERWATAWEREARTLFLNAYVQTAQGSPIIPRDPDVLARALAVFELEKAVYELGYEMNNRPDWLWVPVEGIRAILGGRA